MEGDSFRCLCNPGFQEIENGGEIQCVDINECQRGQHTCDINALCINEVGTYRCQCKTAYVGDGRTCNPASFCADVTCPENAHCVQTHLAQCECLPGFTFTGQECVALKGHSCYYNNNCSPLGYCALDTDGEYKCFCIPPLVGDGYTCVPSSETDERTTTMIEQVEVTETTPFTSSTADETKDSAEEQLVTDKDPEWLEENCIFGQCWCAKGYEKVPDSVYCRKIAGEFTTLPTEGVEEGGTLISLNLQHTASNHSSPSDLGLIPYKVLHFILVASYILYYCRYKNEK